MELLLAQALLALALVGNTALWVTFLNRTHGLGAWRPLIHGCSALALIGAVCGPVVLAASAMSTSPASLEWLPTVAVDALRTVAGVLPTQLATAYTWLCLLATLPCAWWIVSGWMNHMPANLRSDQTTRIDMRARLHGTNLTHGIARLARFVPWNDVLQVDVSRKTLAVDRLPSRLEGLSLVHLSDLHMSGRIDVEYFREVVKIANSLTPDLICITGDLVDAEVCVGWIGETLGQLNAPLGVYCVLGNHDVCVDLAALRATLEGAGITNLGGSSRRLDVAGETVLLAGNELPWIPAADPAIHDRDAADSSCSLRILLSHSPDQIRWARRRGFDLMLAGHTHGGQIQVPLLGAVLAPSLYGTRYASGLFFEAPTLMHVSRGVSGLTPVRYHCTPEITLIQLTRTVTEAKSGAVALDGQEAMATGS